MNAIVDHLEGLTELEVMNVNGSQVVRVRGS